MRTRLSVGVLGVILFATACGGGSGGGQAETYFLIAGSVPAALELGVARDATVTITFNKKLDVASLSAHTLTVTALVDDSTVPGRAALVNDGTLLRVQWTGTQLLPEDALFTCRVDAGIRSLDGESLAAPDSVRFGTSRFENGVDIPLPADLANTGALHVGRQAHTATLLSDRRVFVCGGFTAGELITSTAEIWDPERGTFVLLEDEMSIPRAGHTATLLADGRVLIAGGYTPQPPLGALRTTATAEIYDPKTGAFHATGRLVTDRSDHGAVLLGDGRVLITGGGSLLEGYVTDLATAEVYADGAFSVHGSPMVHTRFAHAVARNQYGRVLLGGGSELDLGHSYFVEAQDAFVDLGPGASDSARFGPVAERFSSGHFILAGGDLRGTVLHVDRASGKVQNTGSGLAAPRAYAAAARLGNDRIVVIGGIDFNRGNFIQGSMDVIVEGGPVGARTFATSVTFTPPLAFHTATRLAGGAVLICGGLNADGSQANHRNAYLLKP